MENEVTVIGVYADDLLVTTATAALVQDFFISMDSLSILDLEEVRKFLGMRSELDARDGNTFDQQATIE